MEVYMDNSATTRTFPEVAELMTKIMCEDYGNPSSLHMKGVEAEKYLRYAKETLARILKVEERELLFTSGGTESDNMALIGCALANCRRGNHLITTQIEHPAILQTMRYLETQGYRVTYLPVDVRRLPCKDGNNFPEGSQTSLFHPPAVCTSHPQIRNGGFQSRRVLRPHR